MSVGQTLDFVGDTARPGTGAPRVSAPAASPTKAGLREEKRTLKEVPHSKKQSFFLTHVDKSWKMKLLNVDAR